MNILFVCHANQFRSATAEYQLRDMLGSDTEHKVRSAGTHAHMYGEGSHMLPQADYALTLWCQDRSLGHAQHASETFSAEHLIWADVIYTMDKANYLDATELLKVMKKQVALAPILTEGRVNFDHYVTPSVKMFHNPSGVRDCDGTYTDDTFIASCRQIAEGCRKIYTELSTSGADL